LASAYGAEYYWGDSLDQTPGIRAPIITDLEAQVDSLPHPNPHTDGWLPEGLRRIRMFAEAGDGFIPVSLLDAAGGINVAADLLGMTEALLAIKTAPEALHGLLDNIQDPSYAPFGRASGRQAARNIATTDFRYLVSGLQVTPPTTSPTLVRASMPNSRRAITRVSSRSSDAAGCTIAGQIRATAPTWSIPGRPARWTFPTLTATKTCRR
jgi:hypothetical protein